jgi:hypothetical protein
MHSESQHLEYKREVTDTLEREVVGFLNSREGGRRLRKSFSVKVIKASI